MQFLINKKYTKFQFSFFKFKNSFLKQAQKNMSILINTNINFKKYQYHLIKYCKQNYLITNKFTTNIYFGLNSFTKNWKLYSLSQAAFFFFTISKHLFYKQQASMAINKLTKTFVQNSTKTTKFFFLFFFSEFVKKNKKNTINTLNFIFQYQSPFFFYLLNSWLKLLNFYNIQNFFFFWKLKILIQVKKQKSIKKRLKKANFNSLFFIA